MDTVVRFVTDELWAKYFRSNQTPVWGVDISRIFWDTISTRKGKYESRRSNEDGFG
jgi:hypothetical protein